jgi:hypothetical protein
MSVIFNQDTSTQGGTPTFVSTTYNTKDNPNIKMKTKCGIYNSGDNIIKIFTNNIDALTIDNNQKVICNGSLITTLSYANIDGKPTNFQADWNSTIINKPSNFQADWNSTIIN